jgi:hypothetical protein
MNWRKGLFRAWVVFAICWAGVVGVDGILAWHADLWHVESEESSVKCNPPRPNVPSGAAEPTCTEANKRNGRVFVPWLLPKADQEKLLNVLWEAVAPPASLLLFGAALFWVASGFRVRRS